MAQDSDKHPKEPFNRAAQKPEIEIVFEAEIDIGLEDDNELLRSNTDPKHDPVNVKNPSLTPSGMGNFFPPPRAQDQGPTPIQPEDSETYLSDEEWQHALRNGNHTFEEEFNGLRVRAWQTDKPLKDGFEGGHLNQIIVTQGDYGHELELAHFKDGDWEKRPEATPERQAVMEAVQEYDGKFLKQKLQEEEHERASQQEIGADKDKGKSR